MKFTCKEFRIYSRDGNVHLECEGKRCLVVDHAESDNQTKSATTNTSEATSPTGTTRTVAA